MKVTAPMIGDGDAEHLARFPSDEMFGEHIERCDRDAYRDAEAHYPGDQKAAVIAEMAMAQTIMLGAAPSSLYWVSVVYRDRRAAREAVLADAARALHAPARCLSDLPPLADGFPRACSQRGPGAFEADRWQLPLIERRTAQPSMAGEMETGTAPTPPPVGMTLPGLEEP